MKDKAKKIIGGSAIAVLLFVAIGWQCADFYAMFSNWFQFFKK